MFVRVADTWLNTVSFGAGPRTVVAFGTWVIGWQGWQCPLELLSTRWRCVAYDHRGSGASPAAPDTITHDTLINDLFAVMDECGVDRCVLAVESSSAILALSAVHQRPERFEGLVLVAGIPVLAAGIEHFVAAMRADLPTTVRDFIAACMPAPGHEHLRSWLCQQGQASEPEHAARLFECLYGIDMTPILSTIAVPTLLIHGVEDAVVPLASSETMARALPRSELVTIPHGDHVPIVSAPDVVAQHIDTFLQQLP